MNVFLKSHNLFLNRVSTPGAVLSVSCHTLNPRAVTCPEDNGSFMCETCPDSVLELKGTWIPPCNKLQLESWHPSGPSIPDLSGITSLTHLTWRELHIPAPYGPVQLYGASKDSRVLRKHLSELLSLKGPALARLVQEVFSSLLRKREVPQNPANDTQS